MRFKRVLGYTRCLWRELGPWKIKGRKELWKGQPPPSSVVDLSAATACTIAELRRAFEIQAQLDHER